MINIGFCYKWQQVSVVLITTMVAVSVSWPVGTQAPHLKHICVLPSIVSAKSLLADVCRKVVRSKWPKRPEVKQLPSLLMTANCFCGKPVANMCRNRKYISWPRFRNIQFLLLLLTTSCYLKHTCWTLTMPNAISVGWLLLPPKFQRRELIF